MCLDVAMDRYTPGISYYASIKAAQHSADFQKAQNSQSSGGKLINMQFRCQVI